MMCMCVTGYPDLNIRILGTGDLFDIIKYNTESSKGTFKYLQEKSVGISHARDARNKQTQKTNQPLGITGAQLWGGHRADGAAQPASSSSAP